LDASSVDSSEDDDSDEGYISPSILVVVKGKGKAVVAPRQALASVVIADVEGGALD
jgi:hypothetical protein